MGKPEDQIEDCIVGIVESRPGGEVVDMDEVDGNGNGSKRLESRRGGLRGWRGQLVVCRGLVDMEESNDGTVQRVQDRQTRRKVIQLLSNGCV